jgi:hypothetical protein
LPQDLPPVFMVEGHFLAACIQKLKLAFDVLPAEAIAFKQGLSLSHSIWCNRIIINSC